MNTQEIVRKPNPEAPAEGAPSATAPSGRPGRGGPGLRVLGVGGLVIVALASVLTAGTIPRLRQQHEVNAAAAAAASAPPRVTVVVAKPMATDAERVLPGTALPFMEAALYARTTGYLKRRLVDIGDRVQEGQLLAEISAPDNDDQLAQAQANLSQAKANLTLAEANAVLARTTLARDVKAGAGFGVSQELIDQDQAKADTTAAQVKSTQASIQVNEAMVQRYTDLQNFQKITAPFKGVITARNVDAGDLMTADSPSSAREMFHLMRTDVLRVFVNVPQVFATGIKVNLDAVVYRRENPQKTFPGKVTRTADALDPNSRTLLTQVDVPNPDNVLRPGMYLQVKFVFDRNVLPVVIPSAALATRTGAPRVAVLDDQNRVQYRHVDLGRDFGSEIQVLSGIKPGETIVVHPGDDLPEGVVVEPVTASK